MKLKQFILFATLTMSLLLVGTSCVPKATEVEDATLTLSGNSLLVSEDGVTPTAPQITVTTNQKAWNAMSNSEWLKAARSGNGLLITALPNTEGKERTAEIGVFAGGLMEKIIVTQAAAKKVFTLDLDITTINAPYQGEKYLIDVRAQSDKWSLELVDLDWVVARSFTNFIELTVKPNTNVSQRMGKIFVKLDGAAPKEIVVNQEASKDITTQLYALPYFGKELNVHATMTYEENLGNFVIYYRPGTFNIKMQRYENHMIRFAYGTKVFDDVRYFYYFPQNVLERIVMLARKDKKVSYSQRVAEELRYNNYVPYLTEHGFKVTEGDSNSDIYWLKNDELGMEVVVSIRNTDKYYPGVVFFPFFKQDKQYPTYTTLPEDGLNLLKEEPKLAALIERSTQDGYTFLKRRFVKNLKGDHGMDVEKYGDEVYDYLVTTDDENNDVVVWQYFFNWEEGVSDDEAGKLMAVWEYRRDYEKVLWRNPQEFYQPTEEFEALMAKEGFIFDDEDQRNEFWYHKPITFNGNNYNYKMCVMVVEDNMINDGEPTLRVRQWLSKLGANGSDATDMTHYPAAIRSLSKTPEEWEQYLYHNQMDLRIR